MGCSGLWKVLAAEGLVESFKGGNRGDYERILKELQGKILAVDCSVWLMEVKSLTQLRSSVPTEMAAYLKVILEKVMNMLRLGCTPVIVFEGLVDKSKYELLSQRYKKTYVQKAGHPNRFAELKRFTDALGIVSVKAPGEGEAMCAALDALGQPARHIKCEKRVVGLVDGCVTRDADALSFGAQTVFKTLTLSSRVVRNNELEICRLSKARGLFEICSGGTLAMRLLTLLNGGDYNLGGTRNVGSVKALATVQALLKNKLVHPLPRGIEERVSQDDVDLIQDFWRALLTVDSPVKPPPTRCCTGCRTCGCPLGTKGRRIDRHGEHGCLGCGTHNVELGGTGEGGCIALKAGESCRCPFCQWRHGDDGKRDLMTKVFTSARRQSLNHTTLDNALKTYDRQQDLALQAARGFAHRAELAWQRRPNVPALTELLEKHLTWDAPTVRDKLMPLLLDWDAAHRFDPEREFSVSEVVSLGTRGRNLGNQTSELFVRFKRREGVNPETQESDIDWLVEKADGGKWAVRKELVDAHYTDLIREFKDKKGKKKPTAASRKITEFFKQSENPDDVAKDASARDEAREELFKTPSKVARKSFAGDTPQGSMHRFSPGSRRLVGYSATLGPTRRPPFVMQRVQKRRTPLIHDDLRQYCSPSKRPSGPSAEEVALQGGRDTGGLGSVPRRLTSLTIESPERRLPLEDAVTKLPEPSADAFDEAMESVDLLTPRGTAAGADELDGSVIDLLSECSPRM